MKTINLLGLMTLGIALSAFTTISSMNWKVSNDFSIKFTSEDPTGVFTEMDAEIQFDEANLKASKFNVKIDVNSINTGNGMQNKHAKSDKWFDAKKFPTIDFISTEITKAKIGYEARGNLLMHGNKKEIIIPFLFMDNTFKGRFTVDRLDYQIGTTEGKSAKVPAKLLIEIVVPVTK